MKLFIVLLLSIAGVFCAHKFILPYGNGGWFVLAVFAWLAAGIFALSAGSDAHG